MPRLHCKSGSAVFEGFVVFGLRLRGPSCLIRRELKKATRFVKSGLKWRGI